MANKMAILDDIINQIAAIKKASRNTPSAAKAWKGNSPEFKSMMAKEWMDEQDLLGDLTNKMDLIEGFGGNSQFVRQTPGRRVVAFTEFANKNPDKVKGTSLRGFVLDSEGNYGQHPRELLEALDAIPDSMLEKWGVEDAKPYRKKKDNEIDYNVEFFMTKQ